MLTVLARGVLILAAWSAHAQTPATGEVLHRGTGKVLLVDASSGYVELDHDPIASLRWPRMSMGFQAQDGAQLSSLRPGDRVEFEMYAKPNGDGDFVLRSIRRAGGGNPGSRLP